MALSAASRFAIAPTPRAAILVAVAAPVALVIAAVAPGAWIIAPALCGAVLALVLADAIMAGPLTAADVAADEEVEVGQPGTLRLAATFGGGVRSKVDAALGADARLLPGGRGQFALHRENATQWHHTAVFTPDRRGTGQIERLWLRWTGPLGLGSRVTVRALDRTVRVWPDLSPVRSPTVQAFLRDSGAGMIARRARGQGNEFEALVDFQPGMDRRRINWKASARHGHLYAREFESERNNQIVLAFDCGRAMCEPVDGLARIDRAVSAGLATAWVALKGGDRVALYGFAAQPEVATPFVSGTRDFRRLQNAAAELDYHAQETNFTLALATLSGRLARRSLIVVFSDFTDPTSAELMIESVGRLMSRHVVLFVVMTDTELEGLAAVPPACAQDMAMAVTAGQLLRQRALVTRRLRQIGVDVIEAPHAAIGPRLIDAYLALKYNGAIG